MDKETIAKAHQTFHDTTKMEVSTEIDMALRKILQSQTQDIIKKVEGMRVEVVGDDRIAVQNNITIEGVIKILEE